MWACLQDQETQGHWKHVTGWRKVCDLAQAHLRRLRQYRSGLAEAWPPATNAAARTYLGELDELISKVQHTHDTAAANHDALAAAARAIDSARPEIKRLRDDYATKLGRKRGYEATLADPKAAAGSRVVDPPVTDADLEKLNVQARGIMFGLSGELQQAQVMLQKPPPKPRPTPGIDQNNPDIYSPSFAAPTIPPILPVPVTPATTAAARPGVNDQLGMPQKHAASNSGPILGSASAGIASHPATQGSSSSPPQGTHGNKATGSPLPPIAKTTGRDGPPGPIRGPLIPPSRTGFGGVHGSSPSVSPRPMPPGGLIGGAPGVGFGQPSGTAPARRVNPIGGVIGGGGAGTTPTGAAGSRPGGGRINQSGGGIPVIPPTSNGTSPQRGSLGRSDRGGSREEDSRRWDPDQPWQINEGGPPVVRPPDEQGPINPGPAIGLDR